VPASVCPRPRPRPWPGLPGAPGADGSLHIYIALTTSEDWISGVDFTDTATATAITVEQFAGWAPQLQALITEADNALVPRTINALPIGHRWDRVPGVTLLGDAAHVMSPFAGEGDIEAALVVEYEKALFPRLEQAAREAATNLEICFRDDAPQSLIDQFAAYGHAE
jgi:hypothetical protein